MGQRIWRWVEGVVLGAIMAAVAWLVDRRLQRAVNGPGTRSRRAT